MSEPTGPTRVPLAASEAFAFVTEVRDYAIYMIDPGGHILTWNEGARAIKGYTAEQILGHSFSRFFTEEDLAQGKPARLLARGAAEGRVQDEGWRVRQDGTRFWADVVLTAVYDRGNLRGFVKVTRDLTVRKQAEEKLRQSEESMRLLVESVKDYAIFMLDPEGRITSWNRGAERINGYRADEVIGQHFSLFYPPEALATQHPVHELAIATREGRYEEEGWRLRKGGERFWASVVITAIHDPQTGRLRGFAKVTRDLTERRHIEEQAQRERMRAEETQSALEQRDEFIGLVAHELRTPLAALVLKVQGITRAMDEAGRQGQGVAPKLATRLHGAIRQTERIAELVERILDVARVVQGKLVMERAPTSLLERTARVVDRFREPAARNGTELHLRASGDPVGEWDEARIEQAVAALLANAVKYGSGQPVELVVEDAGPRARLLVTDHGIGIAPADVDRIFLRFGRAVPVRHYGGLGLGLYIARSIVEAHGGAIHVSSHPNQGTTFMIELPKHLAPEHRP